MSLQKKELLLTNLRIKKIFINLVLIKNEVVTVDLN